MKEQEGIPRYEIELKPKEVTIRQKRTYGKDVFYIYSPSIMAFPIQEAIVSANDVDITLPLKVLLERPLKPNAEKKRVKALIKLFTRRLKSLRNDSNESLGSVFGRTKQSIDELRGTKAGLPNIIAKKAYDMASETSVKLLNIENPDADQKEIVSYCGYHCAWQGLRAGGVPSFSQKSPFEPLLLLFEYGLTNISFPIINGDEHIKVRRYGSKHGGRILHAA